MYRLPIQALFQEKLNIAYCSQQALNSSVVKISERLSEI